MSVGMYTEFHFNVELKSNTPENVIEMLKAMVNCVELTDFPESFDHPLFNCDRWHWFLTCDSYYFSADTSSTIRYDKIAGTHYLCIRSNHKNYDDEIEHFIDWIMPYIKASPGDFLGFYRYEETEIPTLIFMGNQIPIECFGYEEKKWDCVAKIHGVDATAVGDHLKKVSTIGVDVYE